MTLNPSTTVAGPCSFSLHSQSQPHTDSTLGNQFRMCLSSNIRQNRKWFSLYEMVDVFGIKRFPLQHFDQLGRNTKEGKDRVQAVLLTSL